MRKHGSVAQAASAVVIIAGFVSLSAAAKPALVIADPFQLRLGGAATSFTISATEDHVDNVAIKLVKLEAPDGSNLPSDTLTFSPVPVVTQAASAVDVKVAQPDRLAVAGDYKITINAEGKNGNDTIVLSKSGTLTRLKPELSAPELKDTIVTLVRCAPGAAVSGSRTVRLHNAGYSNAQPTFGLRFLNADGDVTGAPGEGSVTVAKGKNDAGPGFNDYTLTLTNFRRTGTFPATLLISVPGGGAPIEVPFKVVVTDWWLFPLIFIALGVGLALLVRILSTKLRPQAENRVRALELGQQLADLRANSADPTRTMDADALAARILDAQRQNDDGATADAKTRLDAIQTDLTTLRNAILTDQRDAALAHQTAQDAIASVKLAGPLTTADQQSLDGFRQRLGDAEKKMESKLFIAAKNALTSLAADATALAGQIKGRAGAPTGARLVAPAAAQASPQIRIEDPPAARTAGRNLSFTIDNAGQPLTSVMECVWNFGDKLPEQRLTSPFRANHTYADAGVYAVTASLRNNGAETMKLSASVAIGPSPAQVGIASARWEAWKIELTISAIAAVVAVVTGLWALYTAKPFGSVAQYAEAFVWGFGIDNSVRGFAAVLQKF